MAKKIAVDWDEHELRIVAGRTSPNGVTVTDAWVVPIRGHDVEAVTKALHDELAARGFGKQAALLAIGRGKAELRQLKLPPIPETELPEIVRFQATRDFATAGEKAITDFVPSRRTEEGVEVVAAALDPKQLDQLRKITTGAGLEVQRVALRPLSAAALFAAKESIEGEVVLIDLLADDADIVVLRDGRARFVRSVRLSAEGSNRPGLLAGEVRRSLMACRDSQDSQQVQRRLLIWGRADVHAEDVRVLAERTGDHVETIDPLSLVEVDRKLRDQAPEHVGRFAPLIGLLQIDEAGSELMIDFLNPRKPPEPRNDRLRYSVFGSIAAAVVLLIGYMIWSNLSTRDNQIADLQTQLNAMSETVKTSDEQVAKVERIDAFLSGNVVWLDEIRRVATEMPPADQAIVSRLSASVPARTGGGQLTLAGTVTNPGVIDAMEAALRDEQHRVVGAGSSAAGSEGPYDWAFSETIVIEPAVVLALRRQADQAAGEQATSESDSGEDEATDAASSSASANGQERAEEASGARSAADERQPASRLRDRSQEEAEAEAPDQEPPGSEAPDQEPSGSEAPDQEPPGSDAPQEGDAASGVSDREVEEVQ